MSDPVEQTEEQRAAAEAADAQAEAAAAEAAFGQARGAEPATKMAALGEQEARTAEEIAADTKAEQEANAQAAKDAEEAWFRQAPASVRESLEAISGMTGRLRRVEGHIGGLTTAQRELRAAVDAARQQTQRAGGAAPTDAEIAAANTSAKWKQMKEDFPDWAEAMEERLTAMRGPAIDIDGITKKVSEGFAPALKSVEARARQYARVDIAHDGWEETVKTPEFVAWLKSQPADMQALAASEQAKDAIRLLDGFKAAGKPKDTPEATPAVNDPKARLAAAVAPTRGAAVTTREVETEDQAAERAFKRVRTGT